MMNVNDQGGYVLVLSLFMMVLLSMIGLAALMTGTTDIDIAGNDKFHLMAFYEAESGLNIAAEIIQQLNGYDSAADVVDSEGYFDDNGTIRIHDLDFLQEPREVGSNVVWDKQAQNEWIEARTRGVAGHGSIKLLAAGSQPDIEVGGNIFIDVDNIGSAHVEGSAVAFGVGDMGPSASEERTLFNIDSIGGPVGGGQARANHMMGYQFLQ